MVQRQVTTPVTLHARPAAQVVAAAAKVAAKIRIGHGGKLVEAKSLLGLLSLGASAGASITIEAEGADEESAAQAMADTIAGLHE